MEGSHISTEELWSSVRVTIRFLVTSLTKALLPRLLSLARRPALGSVLVVPNFFHLRIIEATVFLALQYCRLFLVPFPRSVPRHIPVSELYGQFPRPHGFVFPIEFITGGFQSSCRKIKDDQWIKYAPELNFESHSKGSEYLCE